MPHRARFKLVSTHHAKLEQFCSEIKSIVDRTGAKIRGPIPLPTRKLVVPVRRAPDGTGSSTFDHWTLKIHKRLIDIEADERTLKLLLRLRPPEGVSFEVKLL